MLAFQLLFIYYICTEMENFDNDKCCCYDYALFYCKQTSNSFNDFLKWELNGHAA